MNRQPPAVTSYLNALGLGEGYYHQALHYLDVLIVSACNWAGIPVIDMDISSY